MVAPINPRPQILTWLRRNPRDEFYSAPGGRFDLYRSEATGEWVAHDWECGLTARGSLWHVEAWCAEQSAEFPSPNVEGARD
jgi:hypothetical protein